MRRTHSGNLLRVYLLRITGLFILVGLLAAVPRLNGVAAADDLPALSPELEPVRAALAIVDGGHHDDVPVGERPAHTRRGPVRFVRYTDGVCPDGEMRAMLLDHSQREDEQRSLTIEGINLGPGELVQFVDARRIAK